MIKNAFFRYAIELIIVIVGVTAAFWLNTRAEVSKEKKILASYYEELRSDLGADRKSLEFNIKLNERKQEVMVKAMKHYLRGQISRDSIYLFSQEVGNYNFFFPNDITYRTLINSGDLKLIDDVTLKRQLMALYDNYETIEHLQDNHLSALDNNYFPEYVYMVDYITGEVIKPLEENILIKNYFAFSANELSMHVSFYKSAVKRNLVLDSLIQSNLGKKGLFIEANP